MDEINKLKQKSKAKRFASILGKSIIDPQSEEYKIIEEFTKILLDNGYGVIHGGYSGGAMSAVNDTTTRYIKENKLSRYINIGVPQTQHDSLWSRVTGAQFTNSAQDIFARLKLVTSGDIAIICPLGGIGTELEETIIFHENIVHEEMNKHGHQEKITPLIFFQTKNGTDWKALIKKKISTLATSIKDISDYKWLYFVNSLEEFNLLITNLQKNSPI